MDTKIGRRTASPLDGCLCRNSRPISKGRQTQLAANLALARQLGAEVITIADDDLVHGLLRTARENNATQIVFGKPGVSGWWRGRGNRAVLQRLIAASGDVDVLVVRADKSD